MTRPDLDTFACVNPECQRFRLTGQGNLTIRKSMARTASDCSGAASVARSSLSDVAPHCSTPKSRRPRLRTSLTIWVKDAGCVPPPA
jgi:hypothetical protein